jgi:tert-butyl alcohol monooxygenase / tert-amyl alcohol desaturase
MLGAPFDGYRRRDVPPPDPELTRVGPGTPCGEYLRRFWQPVAFVRDLAATPLRAQILGEDLVVFRDRGGRVGALHLHCAHRGTSLEFGIPVERGIRCCYHGWVYDVDGRCLETPGEPTGSQGARLAGRLSDARARGPGVRLPGTPGSTSGVPDLR